MASNLIEELKARRAFIENDHLVLTSGKHSRTYANFDWYFEPRHERELKDLCFKLALNFSHRDDIDVVVGPETGGGIIATLLTEHLSAIQRRNIRAVTAFKIKDRKLGKDFFFQPEDVRRLRGAGTLLVDDVLSTGSSFDPVLMRLRSVEADVIGLALFVNRSGLGAAHFQVPFLHAEVSITPQTWTPDECRRSGPCSEGKPINTVVGHGDEYVAKHGQP